MGQKYKMKKPGSRKKSYQKGARTGWKTKKAHNMSEAADQSLPHDNSIAPISDTKRRQQAELQQAGSENQASSSTDPPSEAQPSTSTDNVAVPKPNPPKPAPRPKQKASDTGRRASDRVYQLDEKKTKAQEEYMRTIEADEKIVREKTKELQEMRRLIEDAKAQKELKIEAKECELLKLARELSSLYMVLPPKRQRLVRISAIMLMNEFLDEQEMEERIQSFNHTK